MAAKLYNLGVPRDFFDTIFVDEGGQALEPETIAPIAPLLSQGALLVIAGDPKQLRPHHSFQPCQPLWAGNVIT